MTSHQMEFFQCGRYSVSRMLLCFLVGLSSTKTIGFVGALKEIPLPHLDIFILCSNDVRDIDYVKELDGFYTDLIPSAEDIIIESGKQEFLDCNSNENRTRVEISADGVAAFTDETPLDEVSIQMLVTNELLEAYFKSVCEEMDIFDAVISEAGSEEQVGINAAFAHLACDLDPAFVDSVVRTSLVVGVVSGLILLCCCVGCILLFCGFCS